MNLRYKFISVYNIIPNETQNFSAFTELEFETNESYRMREPITVTCVTLCRYMICRLNSSESTEHNWRHLNYGTKEYMF